MEFLKEWTLCVCASLICAAVMSLFSPRGKMNGFYKILISLFVFISFLYPLRNVNTGEISFENPYSSIREAEENKLYEDAVSRRVKKLLSDNKIEGATVSSKLTFNAENGEIIVEEITVSISDEYSKKEVEKLIFDKLGLNARVMYVGA